MISLRFPEKKPEIRVIDEREEVFCLIRRKWLMLTPEEWVRQNVLLYVTITLGYPSSLIAVERQIMVGEMKKRFDVLVFDNSGQPHMVVECKEMEVTLTEQVIMQALRYNMVLRAPYVVITNGMHCAAFSLHGNEPQWLDNLPQCK